MTLVLSTITVILVLITTVTAILTYRRGTKRRLLLYKVVTRKTKIARSGKRPQTCYEVAVAVMNVGLHDILVEDFNGGQALEIDLGTPIFATGPLKGEQLNKVQVRVEGSSVFIEPILIPSGAFLLRQVLTFEKPNERLAHRSLGDIPVQSAMETSNATFRRFGWAIGPPLMTFAASMGAYRGFTRNQLDEEVLRAASLWIGSIQLFAILLAVILLARFLRTYSRESGAFRFKLWSTIRRSRKRS